MDPDGTSSEARTIGWVSRKDDSGLVCATIASLSFFCGHKSGVASVDKSGARKKSEDCVFRGGEQMV